jgi:hypothetical protein
MTAADDATVFAVGSSAAITLVRRRSGSTWRALPRALGDYMRLAAALRLGDHIRLAAALRLGDHIRLAAALRLG